MKIKIKELGAIKEGTIDLTKKLNVFCGPNGTGKTYVAYVLYGLMKSKIHIGTNKDLSNKLIEFKKAEYKIDFAEVDKYRKELIENFKDDFDGLFGIGTHLTQQYFKDTEIDFVESKQEFHEILLQCAFENNISIGKIDLAFTKKSNTDIVTIEILDKTISSKDIEPFNLFFYSALISLLATHPISSTYILPVERNSIFTFNKELSIRKQEAVDHFHAMTGKGKIDKFDLLFNKTTRYPLAIKDGLLVADDLAEIKKNISQYFDFAKKIESDLLNGTVEISSEGELQFKPKQSPKKVLPIHMTASIIKSLSSLVIYLKHIAQKNDLIIIDEPEINLHPDNQIILTRLFAKLINNGFRILISTHSDYVVREINNLIMLSSDKAEISKLRKKFGYEDDESITKDDVDVHYFNYPQKMRMNKQVSIKNLLVEDTGFEIPSVDKTIDDQNNIAEEIFYSLKYENDEE